MYEAKADQAVMVSLQAQDTCPSIIASISSALNWTSQEGLQVYLLIVGDSSGLQEGLYQATQHLSMLHQLHNHNNAYGKN